MYAKQLLLLLGLTVSLNASQEVNPLIVYTPQECAILYNNFLVIAKDTYLQIDKGSQNTSKRTQFSDAEQFQEKINSLIISLSKDPNKHTYIYEDQFQRALVLEAARQLSLVRPSAPVEPSVSLPQSLFARFRSPKAPELNLDELSIKFLLAELLLNDFNDCEEIMLYFIKAQTQGTKSVFPVVQQLEMFKKWYQNNKKLNDRLDLEINVYTNDYSKNHIQKLTQEIEKATDKDKPRLEAWKAKHEKELFAEECLKKMLKTFNTYLRNNNRADECLEELVTLGTDLDQARQKFNTALKRSYTLERQYQQELKDAKNGISKILATQQQDVRDNNKAQNLTNVILRNNTQTPTPQEDDNDGYDTVEEKDDDRLTYYDLDDEDTDDDNFFELNDETNEAFNQRNKKTNSTDTNLSTALASIPDRSIKMGTEERNPLNAPFNLHQPRPLAIEWKPTEMEVQTPAEATQEPTPAPKPLLKDYTRHLLIGVGAAAAAATYAYKNNDTFANLINSGASSASNGIKSISESLAKYAAKQGPILGKYLENGASMFNNYSSSFGSYLQNSWNNFDASKTFNSFINKIESF